MDKLIQNPEVKTLGCRLNFWESEIIRDQLVKNEIFEKLINNVKIISLVIFIFSFF